MIQGIDISAAQAVTADWEAARNAGIAYAWIKATEGNAGHDPNFWAHLKNATLADIRVGAYHFCRPNTGATNVFGALRKEALVADARAEAEFFHVTTTGWGSQSETMPPLIDLESAGPGLTTGDLLTWLGAHLDRVQQLFGVVPVVYTGAGFTSRYPGFAAGTWLAEFPLMIAAYPLPGGKAMSPDAAAAHAPPELSPWGRPKVWQYSGGGMGVPGNTCPGFGSVPIDRSIAYVDSLDDLRVVMV